MVETQDINPASLMEDMPFPLIILSKVDRTILWGNAQAEMWFGRSLRNTYGQDLVFLTSDVEAFDNPVKRVVETGGVVSAHDVGVRRPNAEVIECNLTLFPCDAGVAVLLRPSKQESGHQSDGDTAPVAALGRMLAHELKNPLAGIKGAAQLLASEAQSGEARELINLIATETDRIRRLADRMEAFGDVDSLNKEAVNIHSVLRQAMLLAQSSAKKKIEYIENYDPSLPLVFGDRDALMQVALNLLVNATEALSISEEGNKIQLETAYSSGMRRDSKGNARALPIEIRVIDNGPGIAKHIRGQLFQPFVTDKPAGRGLGLTLVSKIVAAHGGVIDVSSRPGETIFYLRLPANSEPNSTPNSTSGETA